ncbi:MAG: PorP/SprF family type IX secretion system membrane protein, partial [Flavobacteriales bacterium]|nr:PorP/SprF family type IX secretion system membrane protein [Flavobacteriales bacterium]
MKKLIPLLLVVFTFLQTKAQDIHFTMYDVTPVLFNPATTGVFNGDFRGMLNYRSQWASIGNPYTTYSVNIDGGLFKNKWKSGYIGAGMSIYKDVAGASNLGLTKINLSLSSVIYLDSKNSASIGFTGSWGQNSIDPSGLQWDSQFNGQTFDASMPSNESFQ